MTTDVDYSRTIVRAIGGKRLVIAGGMNRSGSTWIYNIARFSHQEVGGAVYGTWIADFRADRARAADCVVLKIHEADATLRDRADRVLTSFRDLRDVVRSARCKGWATSDEGASNLLRQATADHAFWAENAEFNMRYEALMRDQSRAAAAVGRALGFGQDDEVHERALAATLELAEPIGNGGHDPVTLLHPHHRFRGSAEFWDQAISPSFLHRIEREHGPWLRRHGYDAPSAD